MKALRILPFVDFLVPGEQQFLPAKMTKYQLKQTSRILSYL